MGALTGLKRFDLLGLFATPDCKVLWVDDKEWDIVRMPFDDIPSAARLYQFKGDEVYLLAREPMDGTYNFKVFDNTPVNEKEIAPSKLNRATFWPLIRKVFVSRPKRDEQFEKRIIWAFIISAFVFAIFILIILMG